MAWIGFLVLIALGVYAIFAGIVMQMIAVGFTGKSDGVGFVTLAIGLGLLYLAWANKPFLVVIL
jgi:hypothetical protein